MEWTVQLKTEREIKLRKTAVKLGAHTMAKCRDVAAFIGRVQSVVLAVPLQEQELECCSGIFWHHV